jgi:hypothetical protein
MNEETLDRIDALLKHDGEEAAVAEVSIAVAPIPSEASLEFDSCRFFGFRGGEPPRCNGG